ncbi:hypothetical protein AALO_G00054020 [Alosa alosa]|uniref:Uncharacterized protein n=1 Tax=Alosa alosa TaxID=278164 RepID=A0AAV6H4L1_9TELE|nr:hypothetical protein AALO_G00054020 [Alosa alosa]
MCEIERERGHLSALPTRTGSTGFLTLQAYGVERPDRLPLADQTIVARCPPIQLPILRLMITWPKNRAFDHPSSTFGDP